MAMSGKERQARYMEKHRALHNLRRRQARKKNLPVPMPVESQSKSVEVAPAQIGVGRDEVREGTKRVPLGDDSRGGQTSEVSGITVTPGKFPRMVSLSSIAQPSVPVMGGKPLLYRDDYGRVISESQWERLQKKKVEAKEKNYEIDEWSQL